MKNTWIKITGIALATTLAIAMPFTACTGDTSDTSDVSEFSESTSAPESSSVEGADSSSSSVDEPQEPSTKYIEYTCGDFQTLSTFLGSIWQADEWGRENYQFVINGEACGLFNTFSYTVKIEVYEETVSPESSATADINGTAYRIRRVQEISSKFSYVENGEMVYEIGAESGSRESTHVNTGDGYPRFDGTFNKADVVLDMIGGGFTSTYFATDYDYVVSMVFFAEGTFPSDWKDVLEKTQLEILGTDCCNLYGYPTEFKN